MSKIKNGGLDQYGTEPFEQQQFGTSGVEGVNSGEVIAGKRHDVACRSCIGHHRGWSLERWRACSRLLKHTHSGDRRRPLTLLGNEPLLRWQQWARANLRRVSRLCQGCSDNHRRSHRSLGGVSITVFSRWNLHFSRFALSMHETIFGGVSQNCPSFGNRLTLHCKCKRSYPRREEQCIALQGDFVSRKACKITGRML